ncbi:MAG: putative integral rane protein [Candidatus Sulfotelmatobacter sp.]|nr:putative integral rane protein [Candidatus Sulfotelmatobacter sp.]
MNTDLGNGRNLAAVLVEMKEELKEFLETRLAMFKTELREKLKMLKVAAPLALLGIVLLGTAYLLFTLALVGLVAAFLHDNPFRWCFAFLAVAVLWSLLGGVAAYFAKREFELNGLMPNRTLQVLKGDKVWIRSEAKNQI